MDPVDVSPLFTPITINGVTLPNRFVMPAMQRGHCEKGKPTTQMARYYAARAKGGVSLLVGESSAVDHPSSTAQDGAAYLFGDALEGWRECIEAVKAEGGQMLLQLWHEGGVRKENHGGPCPEAETLSPSGLVQAGKPNGRAATLEELEEIKQAFVEAALQAKALGAAGVEVHAAHGYFLDLFLWDETNQRTDQFGGPGIANRLAYPRDIVAAVRQAVGPDFIVSVRFSQWKEVDFDAQVVHSPEELEILLKEFTEAGVDLFSISTRRLLEPAWREQSPLCLAAWAKQFTDLPVIAVGSVGLDKDLMTNLFGDRAEPTGAKGMQDLVDHFAQNEFDLVAVGRALIGDAEWVNKVRDGRWSELKPFAKEDMMTEWEMGFVLEAHDQKE